MTNKLTTTALFPLNMVLFPGSILPLKIFEQRYLELVKTCMKKSHGFVVVLINEGHEVDDTPTVYCVGSYVEITDFESLDNGLLGITIKAIHRVRITNTTTQHDGLLNGMTEAIPDNEVTGDETLNREILEKFHHLKEVLESLTQHPLIKAQYADINYQSAIEISYRLSEFLPTSNINKQELLETANVEDRLNKIETLINQMQS